MSTSAFDTIKFGIVDGVATLTLNRPDRMNSFNTVMHGEVKAALDQVEGDNDVRVLVITGEGRGFCAGQDLGDRAVKPGGERVDLGASIENYYNPLIRRIRGLPIPVICGVNGVAAGAGANIALACDIVIAARSASFIQPFCNIGLVPDSGGTYVLPRLVGPARAAGLAMLGTKLPADKAEDWGLIWQAVDDEELGSTVRDMAIRLAKAPTRGLATIKKALSASLSNTLDEQLDLERDLQREMGYTEDYQEGVAAFLESANPNSKAGEFMSSTETEMNEQAVAERVAKVMFENDIAAQHLGISIEEVEPGYAKLTMTVGPEMINGHEICHGGMIFSLADTAFAYACNSRNEATVAAGCNIEFLAPARKGVKLTAVARETAKRGRQGVYDMTVTDEAGDVIAVMRGKSASLRRPVYED